MEFIIDILGWIGSVAVVAAYGLNMYQKIKSEGAVFLALNLSGGILLIVYTVFKEAYPNTFINVVWVLVAIPAVIRLMRKK